jgi:putative N6-adenine-specific DNA methylase
MTSKAKKDNRGLGKSRILITCAKGVPPYLKEELLRLGYPVLSEGISGIATEGTIDDTLRLNLMLRTGHRVLFLIREFVARDAEALYGALSEIAWEDYIDSQGYVCVTSSVDNPGISDSRYANLRCKDAIVDRIKAKCGRRPDSGPSREGTVVNLYWKGHDCSVYFDTSGEPLSRRGYRKIPMTAPMQETLAAAVIRATGRTTKWPGGGNFINPMCGSGTLAIEAALFGLGRAPGILRDNFGFMHLMGFNRPLWDDLRAQAKKEAGKTLDFRIIATDVSTDAVEVARKNALTAGVQHLIEFAVCDYADTEVPEGGGVIMLNPAYGERTGEVRALEDVYMGIGDFFKHKCMGYTGYIFTGNLALAKKVGLRARRRMVFYNGAIECRLLEYELYEGSRKSKFKKDSEE